MEFDSTRVYVLVFLLMEVFRSSWNKCLRTILLGASYFIVVFLFKIIECDHLNLKFVVVELVAQ